MGRTCREIHEWIEEEIEQPIEEWEDRQEERCREEPCNWWMLCLNKLFCWLVWVTVKVIRWVVVTVGKWVVRVVCTVINFILDVIGFIIGLILAIPIIGGIIGKARALRHLRQEITCLRTELDAGFRV